MSTDIILKHSNQAGKQPDAGSLKQGELAINTKDVKAYIKNADGQVVQIAGADNPTTDGRYLRIDSGAGAQTVASTDPTTFSGQVDLPGGGGDTQALQKQEVEALIADPDGPADGNYLKLAADAGDQIVASTGSTTFNRLVNAGHGVNVTGGFPGEVDYGIIQTGGGSLGVRCNGGYTFVTNTAGQIGLGGALPNAQQQVRLNSDFSSGAAIGYYNAGIIQNDTTSAAYIRGYLQENVSQATTLSSVKLFDADHPNSADVDANLTVTNMYGFYSNVRGLSRFTNSYNFYASGNAPNFFAGDTYIGGTATRNTRELWESLLTEEQKEQLTAGTLAIPANVSNPGDGSFVRQWWYDQQSAEDQALIDSGELEYPTHLQAANFTDTFDLGDNTNITLRGNTPRIDFATGDAHIRLGNQAGVSYLQQFNGDNSRFILGNNGTAGIVLGGANPISNSAFQINGLAPAGLLYGARINLRQSGASDYIGFDVRQTIEDVGTPEDPITIDEAICIQAIGIANEKGATLVKRKLFSANPNNDFGKPETAGTTYGYFSNITGANNFNFYAEGTAPNYFTGITEHKGGVKVTGGTVSNKGQGFIGAADASNGRGLRIMVGDMTRSGGSVYGLSYYVDGDSINIDSDQFFNLVDVSPSFDLECSVSAYNTLASNISGNVAAWVGYNADLSTDKNNITNGYGFYSNIRNNTSDGRSRFNFYAAGTAPNYFSGEVIISGSPDPDPTSNFCRINNQRFLSQSAASANAGYNAFFRRQTNGIYVGFGYYDEISSGQELVGHISRDGDNIALVGLTGGPLILDQGADARNITETAAISNASAVIQQLNPVRINNQRFGFTAADLQPVVSEAVVGTADETLPIGTLADYDGTVLETEVTEPDASELTYTEDVTDSEGVTTQEVRTRTWTETGTQPVYQGVDQTKLIPLLTKALQEALERIEELESGGGGSDFESRIASLEVDMARFKAI